MQALAYSSGLSAFRAHLHAVSKRALSQNHRNQIKHALVAARQRWPRLYTCLHGRFTATELSDELSRRISHDFEILMVHSSYDRLLPMCSAKPHQVVEALLKLCGKNRTLAMPAFTLGGRLYDVAEFYRNRAFNVNRTPSEMGLLTEVFRRWPGVKRSLHPTHSICAFGPLAEQLTATHHLAATRTGKGTPFDLMAQKQTVILGLGVEYYRCLTQTHTAEDLLGERFPAKFKKEMVSINTVDCRGNNSNYLLAKLHPTTPVNVAIVRSLLAQDELREWRFKGVSLFATSAGLVTERLLQAAEKGITIYGKTPVSNSFHLSR